jgi:O-acetylhomoserine/O-acetylserine sulfhydrylase-like pyridoxal-dependent enzyme
LLPTHLAPRARFKEDVYISVGLENPDDVIDDLRHALAA